MRPKWRLKLDLSAHKLEVLTIRLVCEPPHLRLIHPFISTNLNKWVLVLIKKILLVATYRLYDSLAKILHIAFLIKFSSEIWYSAKSQATKIHQFSKHPTQKSRPSNSYFDPVFLRHH